ncbi:acetyltransferase [Paenibacillus sp. sptzw28]|uniref:acetyltransferase n=1 Tax=Paenibacillus sp. sptzw28 TaxID=715179 RepID=UPI001C6EC887|nr:acetyltransferase [Paenibacillus sp. sptzw28]QYR19858.1 acetyltransferase [Paenibacillus sp. sptzw28]
MKELVIWGCGGQAREVLDLCEQLQLTVLGFLDESPEMKGKVVDDLPVLGDVHDIAHLKNSVQLVVPGVGSPALKKRFAGKTIEAGFEPAPALIHPSVRISRRTRIGYGSIICEGSVLTVNIDIGSFVIVNRCATIGHDSCMGDYATVSPGANISGNVTAGEGVFIGTGASIREKIGIGAWSVIGGGAFVKDDVPEAALYAGVPAVMKKRLSVT